MANLTSVGVTAGVPTAGTGTVSTLDNLPNLTLVVAPHAVTNAGTFAVQVSSAPSTPVTNAGTFAVQNSAATPAGTNTIGSIKVTDGTTSLPILAASSGAPAATVPALPVSIRDVNPNGGNTPANSAPVVPADQYSTHKEVAASQTAAVLGATGAIGDYLSHVTVFPGTAGCGVVTILDAASTVGTFAGGGTTALPSLAPFVIPIGAFCTGAGWKITTGANVTVTGVGKFT